MNETTDKPLPYEKNRVPRPGDFPLGSIESRATARAMLGVTALSDCICFPADDPPDLQLMAERDAAQSVVCPIHGRRFASFALTIYRAIRRPAHLPENNWKWRSAQYIRAMRASFPTDRWPAAEIHENDRTVRFVLKDGTEIFRTEPPPMIYDY